MFELIALIILIAIYFLWRPYIMQTAKAGAPFVPMEPMAVEHVMLQADIKPGMVFYELGSGDGRLVIQAGLRGARATGVEIDRWRVWYSRIWLWMLRLHDCRILQQDIFTVDYSDADIVCLYLLQETNEKIQEKLERELKPGTKVISVAFTFPGWNLIKVDPYGVIYGPIYVYQR